MAIASFQNKVFQVSSNRKYTFDEMGWNGSLDTEEQEKLNSKPSTWIKGEKLDEMSFEVILRADFGMNVRSEIEQWEAIKSRAKPDIFILGSRQLGKNRWLLKAVNVSETQVDAKGNYLKATLKLEFQEFVRAGKAPPKETQAETPVGFADLGIVPNQDIFNPPMKAEDKRKNPNLASAIHSHSFI